MLWAEHRYSAVSFHPKPRIGNSMPKGRIPKSPTTQKTGFPRYLLDIISSSRGKKGGGKGERSEVERLHTSVTKHAKPRTTNPGSNFPSQSLTCYVN